MTGTTDVGCGAAVATRLLEISGPDLYRRNAFRITGLPTDASARAVRERRQQVAAALAVGACVRSDSELLLPAPATPHQFGAAFDDLDDVQRRVIEELFWFWETPDATCPCLRSLHGDHDAARRAHARALDYELDAQASGWSMWEQSERDELWIDAAERWTVLLSRPAFWDHIHHRVHTLDDRRLGRSILDAIRNTLPRALVKPVVDLAVAAEDPTRLVHHATRWFAGQTIADDLLAEAAAALHRPIARLTAQATEQFDAGKPRGAIATAYHTVVPALRRLEGLAPHQRHRATATARDTVAVLLTHCALTLMDNLEPIPTAEIGELLDTAYGLAAKAETRRTISNNRAILDDLARAKQEDRW
ncbi:MAG: hypothetical protein ACRDTC_24750 [Pseudonocardiaceae bacterium]